MSIWRKGPKFQTFSQLHQNFGQDTINLANESLSDLHVGSIIFSSQDDSLEVKKF